MKTLAIPLFRQLSLWILGLLTGVAAAQSPTATLTGRVTDAATGKPLPFANVYLNNTTRGTPTNELGRYQLTGIPLGTVEVVVSFIGYQPVRRSIRLDDGQTREVNFTLKSSGVTLADVTVKARKDKAWQRQFREFERQLLGETPFRSQCEITNSHVLDFTDEKNHLKAQAAEPIQIDNKALGYRVQYDMQYFDLEKGGVLYYAGTTRFEEMKPADARQVDRWKANRRRAYFGSLRHLMTSLIAGTYEQEGFLVYKVNPAMPQTDNTQRLFWDLNRHLLPVDPKLLFQPGRLSFERKLVSPTPLKVFYTRVFAPTPYRDTHAAFTELRFPQGQIEVTVDGRITLPMGMVAVGYLGNDRLSTALPEDWQPNTVLDSPANSQAIQAEGLVLAADYRLDSLARRWQQQHPYWAPAVFAHIDKSFYVTGDRLWLSAYALDAITYQPVFGEGALHVDLLTPEGKLVQHQWLPIKEGRATGNFRLSDSLATGVYRLRAYTDEDYASTRPAFERSVTVYNLVRGTAAASGRTTDLDSIDFQFLPEGGGWVDGLVTRLGFKAIGTDGRGRVVSGQIVDGAGSKIAHFASNRLGMGSVELKLEPGKRYQAEITVNGVTRPVDLPLIALNGYSLTADAVSDTAQLILRLQAETHSVRKDAVVYLTFQSYGQLVQRLKIGLQNGKARLEVPFSILPPGLCQITLYDEAARPHAQRLVFIPDHTAPVQLTISPDKPRYTPRERVALDLKVSDQTGQSAVAYLSAAVTDAAQVPDDTLAADIRTHLLLSGDLRGFVEQPNVYFKDTTLATRRALDDLLLTQGWRRIGLRKPLNPSDTLGGVVLSGRVVDEKRNPIPNAQLLVAAPNSKQSLSYSTSTNERGQFRLAGLMVTDTLKVAIQVLDKYFKALKAKIELDTIGTVWASRKMPVEKPLDWQLFQKQLEAARKRQEADPDLYRDRQVKVLKEVTVKGYKTPDRPEHVERMSLHGSADAVLLFDERSPQFANLYEMMVGRLAGVQVARNLTGYRVTIRGMGTLGGGRASSGGSVMGSPTAQATAPLYILDGTYISENEQGNVLLSVNPNDIERIELLKNGATAAIYGVRAGNGVIAFYTKRGDSKEPQVAANMGLNVATLIGFPAEREFYVPRYEATPGDSLPESGRIDRRDVLYWKPIMATDSKGVSTLAFPLSDVVQTVRVVVQGITADGRPVVGTTLLRVQ